METISARPKISFGADGWRGMMAREFTFDNVALVAQAVADYVLSTGRQNQGLVVGRDARFLSEQLAGLVADVLSANRIPVLKPERDAPTSVIAFTVRDRGAAGAIMLTAGQDPPEQGGLTYLPESGNPAMPNVTEAIAGHVERLSQARKHIKTGGEPSLIQTIDPWPHYFAHLRRLIDFDAIGAAGLKFCVDPMFGSGRGSLDRLLRDAGADVQTLHGAHNPLFGGVPPDPVAGHLGELSARVVQTGAHAGLATGGDAARCGVVDGAGACLSAGQVFCLVFLHWLRTRHPQGSVARTAPATHQVDALAHHFGFVVRETPAGFHWVGNAMNTTDAIVGGDESGALSVTGHVPYPDGILAALIVAEQIAKTGKTPRQTLDEIDQLTGRFVTAQLEIALDAAKRDALMQRLRAETPSPLAGQPVVEAGHIDGVQMTLQDGSWLLIQPSAGPRIHAYLEARSEAQVDDLKKAVQTLVEEA